MQEKWIIAPQGVQVCGRDLTSFLDSKGAAWVNVADRIDIFGTNLSLTTIR